jgi:hypothetical protein
MVRCLALLTALVSVSIAAADDKWATIKGQVVLPANGPIPKQAPLNVMQDKQHCLDKGPILDEAVVVNPTNRGIKNVVVFLRPAPPAAVFQTEQFHPADKDRKAVEVVITQPCCMFVERITTARPGDTLVVKNPAPVPHNFFWASSNNGEFNVTIPKEGEWKMPKPLASEPADISYKCTIHGWMSGHVRVFDHPYYAVTDADGKFEIKNAPVGNFNIVCWHEAKGNKGGAKGRLGDPIVIKGPTTELKPIEFDVR